MVKKGFKQSRIHILKRIESRRKKYPNWYKDVGALKLKLSKSNRYNNPWPKGKPRSEKTKKKISKNLIGRVAWNRGKSLTEDTINKIKKARKYQILPIKDTSIEVKIQKFLKQLGIEYFTHQYMKIEHGYQCDVLIPSMNLVIECDGDYWHKYPIGRDIDKIRTSELLNKGFKVLRLWEFEIKKMNVNEFKTRLKL